jgi:hypothetical protein
VSSTFLRKILLDEAWRARVRSEGMGVVEILLKRLADLDGNRAALARQLKVSRQYLSAVLNGDYQPGPKIYEALGLEREVRFVKAK